MRDVILWFSLLINKKEDIYFFEVNTKYISSHVLKISRVLVFSTHEMNFFFFFWGGGGGGRGGV